ncbi:MAG TPA: penicillin-binding transpeptidase domain-containing protein [Polyangia bacterium]|nr:penicillin-binding transpeptidase domain-containing protein [Polyangia bacterium]
MPRFSLLYMAVSSLWSALAFAQSPVPPPANHLAGLKLDTLMRQGHMYVVASADGGHAELTLDPQLQESTEDVLKTFQIPYAGAVVISIPDGRVLAMVGRSAVDPALGAEQLALRPWAPAASVFKVVSAAALVSEAGLSSHSQACYHGGVSSVLPDNLIDIPSIDRRCDTLGYGVGKSQNAILAKLASRHLTADQLARMGHAFGFGRAIPFEIPLEPSHLDVPTDGLEFARTAAGFWHSTLSPIHGALLAAVIANGGTMPTPTLVDRAYDAEGNLLPLSVTHPRPVVDLATAREVGRMMELTTRIGTAKGTFRDKQGHRYLDVEVAGKTGTLSAETDKGYVGYSWFVGYAPADHPTIAFAVALGNHPTWRIKATYVARRIVTTYLAEKGDRAATKMLAAR